MTTVVNVTVEDVAARIAAGYSEIQLESASTVGGSYSSVGTATLVAGTFHYEISDAAGTLNTWYRYRFSDGDALHSDYSNPRQLPGSSRLRIRQYGLENYEAGMVLAATTGGNSTTVPTADARFKSSAFNADRGKGDWLRFTTGSLAGEYRKVTASDPTNGNFTVNPALSGTSGDGDEFEWYWLVRPDQWDAAVNRGLRRYWYLERVPIVGVASAKEYSLSAFPWLRHRDDITGLWHYPYATDAGELQDEAWAGLGRWWQARQDGPEIKLMISPAIDTTKTLYLEAVRRMDELHTDASITPRVCDVRLAAAYAYDEVLAALTRPGNGSATDREAWREERIRHASQELRVLIRENRVNARDGRAQLEEPPVVPRPYTAR